jgi:uncharacterized protein YdeI (YjbR/CyaY-like superfamily)
MNPLVDRFFEVGCMRCKLGGTPACKVHLWTEPMEIMRIWLLDSGLTEELKWGMPCYTHKGKNISMLYAFKECCGLSFFKGGLMKDPSGILEKPGENSQHGRMIKVRHIQELLEIEPIVKSYIQEAIAIEESGAKIISKPVDEYPYPEELKEILDSHLDWKQAFEALTPGRQKGYLLHFSSAKQSATRTARIHKWIPQILLGKGMHD